MHPPLEILSKARALLSEHGQLRSQPASDWRGSFPLPQDIARLYNEIGPVDVTIRTYGNPYFLPSLAKLWEFQAGYRWHGFTGERLADWDDNWVVVAGQGGDPFIFDRASSSVLYALHGQGVWAPDRWSSDLPTMVACLSILGSVVRDARDDFMDDDFNVRPAQRERAIARITEIVGDRSEAQAIVGLAGWG